MKNTRTSCPVGPGSTKGLFAEPRMYHIIERNESTSIIAAITQYVTCIADHVNDFAVTLSYFCQLSCEVEG